MEGRTEGSMAYEGQNRAEQSKERLFWGVDVVVSAGRSVGPSSARANTFCIFSTVLHTYNSVYKERERQGMKLQICNLSSADSALYAQKNHRLSFFPEFSTDYEFSSLGVFFLFGLFIPHALNVCIVYFGEQRKFSLLSQKEFQWHTMMCPYDSFPRPTLQPTTNRLANSI